MGKIFLIIGLMWSVFINAQAPAIQWAKCFGGSLGDQAKGIQQTNDGGYIVCGSTNSTDGDVTSTHGNQDCWIVRLNSNGVIQWSKTLGGSSTDEANAIQKTTDGGYIVVGYTASNDGDVTGNHGLADYWVVKLDSTGVIKWQKTLGGGDNEFAYDVKQTIDGGYIVAGWTFSNNGDVTGHYGSEDCWIVKLDSTGSLQWQKCLGGTTVDEARSVQQTNDGGYIIAGWTFSNNGNVTGNHGNSDFWVVKLDSIGSLQWQKCLGGTDNEFAYDVIQTSDRGYIVTGWTASNDGNVTGYHGNYDFWVVKLDSVGILKWEKTLGSADQEVAYKVQQTNDGGYIVAGNIFSYGSYDYFIVKLNSTGVIQWQKPLGGSGYDELLSIEQTSDGGYVVAGYVNSNDGDVTGNHGNSDFWVVKLAPTSLPLKLLSFTAQKENNNVLLNWQTANEVNVSHINIQRSTNGKEFATIGNVNAGNNEYLYTDNSLPLTVDGRLYYRLETVDKDGSKTYSEVKQVVIRNEQIAINIYPNPAKTFVTIECKEAKEISVIDYLGKTIKQINNPTQPQTINTKQWSKGIYVVKVVMNNGEVRTEKLVVE